MKERPHNRFSQSGKGQIRALGQPAPPAAIRPETMSDNEFSSENNVLLQRPLVAEPGHTSGTAAHNPGASQMRTPKPFTVFQPIPGQNPKPIFTVYAYNAEQARALVAAKIAGETIVVAVSLEGASR
jgi:hypothetical protein